MAKKYKIVRGSHLYRKNGVSPFKVIFGILLVAGLFAAGWFLYEPVYNFVMGIDIIPDQPQSAQSSQAEPSEQSQAEDPAVPTTPAHPEELVTVYLPPEVVQNTASRGSVISDLPAEVNTILIDIKTTDGILQYQSRLPVATGSELISPDAPELDVFVDEASQAGYMVIGRVWAFEDHTAAFYLDGAQVMYGETEYTWIDNSVDLGGQSWLNPYSDLAQSYISDIVSEVMDMGVQGIVLDGVQFPTGVGLNLAGYGETEDIPRSEVLGEFAGEISQLVQSREGIGCWNAFEATELINPDIDELYGPYGGDVQGIADEGELFLNVMPVQLGIGSDDMPAPVTTPGITVAQLLERANIQGDTSRVMPLLQAYTDTNLAAEFNTTYGAEQVAEQTEAAHAWGAVNVAYYNPVGTYVLEGN